MLQISHVDESPEKDSSIEMTNIQMQSARIARNQVGVINAEPDSMDQSED